MEPSFRRPCTDLLLAALLVLASLGLAPAARAGELCVDEDHARYLYDTGWQALQARNWPTAFSHLEFFYLLSVNGPLARDWAFMEELIAAKNHAYAQLTALEEENRRLQRLLQSRSQSGGYSTGYYGQKVAPQAPPLRRDPPRLR